MPRFLIWCYTAVLLAFVSGTLLVTNPPMGYYPALFSLMFGGLLAAGLVTDWVLERIGVKPHAGFTLFSLLIACIGIFGFGGAPGWAAVAVLLTVVAFGFLKRPVPAPAVPAVKEHPVVRAARGQVDADNLWEAGRGTRGKSHDV